MIITGRRCLMGETVKAIVQREIKTEEKSVKEKIINIVNLPRPNWRFLRF